MTRKSEWAWEIAGRAVAVAIPVALLVLLSGPTLSSAGWAALIAFVWLLAIQNAFAAHAGELHPLGAGAAAARGALVGAVVTSAIVLWSHGGDLPALSLLLCTGAIWIGVLGWQEIVGRFITANRRVLVIGHAPELVRETELHLTDGFEIVGMIDDGSVPREMAPTRIVGEVATLAQALAATRPDIVVNASDRRRPEIFRRLIACADLGFRVVEASQFYEYAFGRVPVRDVQHPWFMSLLHLYRRRYSLFAKRAFDVAVASIGLVVVLPLQPFIILAVRSSGGPIFFRQTRIGEYGRAFTMFKYRTMRTDAEAQGARWAAVDDDRTTRTGRLLRRLRLDEVPQLWNVMRGEMSIVGPRPERPEFMEYLEQEVPYWTRRNIVKPGITGWAQVRRGYAADADGALEKLSYDLWYLRHRSMFVDFAICLQTVRVIVTGRSVDPRRMGRPEPITVVEALPSANGAGPAAEATTTASVS